MYFTHDRTDDWLFPLYGNSHHEPLQMKAGEKLRAVYEIYFAPDDLMPHDFSVVVQAEKSAVKIYMDNSRESEVFPTYKLSENVVRLTGPATPSEDGQSDPADGGSTDGTDDTDGTDGTD
jgi:hypothetical protein|mmetsp:Transcript_31737/g.42039  ORF Transcript_31737/g.42039 Transcript_31737/m.42039 type:complete len:120 (+) Transcript_31737:950-1309(+)